MKTVYLAGPIKDQSYGAATDWRDKATAGFKPGIVGISPMRLKEFLKTATKIGDSYEDDLLSNSRAIYVRDKYDCTHADAILAYMPIVSVGTIMELGWADGHNIPIVIVTELPNIKDHPLPAGAAIMVKNLDEGITVINGIFGAYV